MKIISYSTLLVSETVTDSRCCNVLLSDTIRTRPWQTVTGGGSKWCEPTELWLSLLSRSTPWASRDDQRARCGLVLLWPRQNKYTNEHTCSQLHTVKHTWANINNDTDWKPTCTHVRVCLCLEPHIFSSACPRTPSPSSLSPSCSLYLSLLCLHSLHQWLVWSC